jgi:membrane protein DedA with SNARE-associated domain
VSRRAPPKSEYSRSRLVVLILVAAFLALFLFGQILVCGLAVDASWCRLWPHLSIERIQDLVRSAGPWAVVVSIGLMILHSFVPFPSEFITVTNGLVFGFAKGIVVTWVGAMAGAVMAFGLARYLGRPFVMRRLPKSRNTAWRSGLTASGGRLPSLLFSGRFSTPFFKRALSKYYSYGVRYLRKLDELAGNVQNWGEVPTHAAYLEEIRQAHQRKHSFWTRYEAAQKQIDLYRPSASSRIERI